jgi:HD-GYP domain-containing protein (c-di-GMP phosphodiesterase class II)
MRVLAVADVYEALTSERPYRPAHRSADALKIMRPEVPRRLDGEAFAALEDAIGVRDAAAAPRDDAARAETVLRSRHQLVADD